MHDEYQHHALFLACRVAAVAWCERRASADIFFRFYQAAEHGRMTRILCTGMLRMTAGSEDHPCVGGCHELRVVYMAIRLIIEHHNARYVAHFSSIDSFPLRITSADHRCSHLSWIRLLRIDSAIPGQRLALAPFARWSAVGVDRHLSFAVGVPGVVLNKHRKTSWHQYTDVCTRSASGLLHVFQARRSI